MACFALAAATAANAQWYVGGNISFGRSTSSVEEPGLDKADGPTNTSFGITPRIGYIFNNDRWSVGLGLGYAFGKQVSHGEAEDVTRKITQLSVSPYARFNFLYFGPFSMAAEARFSYSQSKDDKSLLQNVRDEKANMLSFRLSPVLQLDVSRHITLESRFDFFSFGYTNAKITRKYEDGGKYISKTDDLRFGVSGDEIFTTGDITFGMIYKF